MEPQAASTLTPTLRKGVIFLLFDFDKFANITATVFPDDEEYSLNDALFVFRYFFSKYEEEMKEPHPPINTGQIVRIIRAMPYINQEDCCNSCVGLEPCDYPVMIDQYFKTYFENCNYRINHFFSGRVRELRYFETLY